MGLLVSKQRKKLYSLISLALFLGLLSPGTARSASSAAPDKKALVFTVSVSDQGAGKTAALRTVTYTITDDAMRIDAPGKDADRSYLWNLSTRTVASLDNLKKTYHADSLDKIMGFVDFSQLLGQSAGNNPKDRVVQSTVPRTVAGVSCTDTTTLHRFKGRVVGMINGDQKIVQCLATDFPGSDLYRSFQTGLAALAKKAAPEKTGAPPPVHASLSGNSPDDRLFQGLPGEDPLRPPSLRFLEDPRPPGGTGNGHRPRCPACGRGHLLDSRLLP